MRAFSPPFGLFYHPCPATATADLVNILLALSSLVVSSSSSSVGGCRQDGHAAAAGLPHAIHHHSRPSPPSQTLTVSTNVSSWGAIMTLELQPGEFSPPQRVWCTASAIRIGFYQAQPCCPVLKTFYKKLPGMVGTEVTVPSHTILGPELSHRVAYEDAEYYELELTPLKPSRSPNRCHAGSSSPSQLHSTGRSFIHFYSFYGRQ